MTRPLSKDLRQRVVAAVENGMTRRGAADRFGVAASTAVRWVRQWRETGSAEPQPQGGDKRSHRIEAHAGEILALVEERPDITLAEIAAHLEQSHGLRVAQSTVWRFFRRHDITFKIYGPPPVCKDELSDVPEQSASIYTAYLMGDVVALAKTGMRTSRFS